MTKDEIIKRLFAAQTALTEIVNFSNVGIKKISTIVKLKRDLNKVIDMDFQIFDTQQLNFINNLK